MKTYCANCGENLGILNDRDLYHTWEYGNDVYFICEKCFYIFIMEMEYYLKPYKDDVSEAKKRIEKEITSKIKNNLKLQNNENRRTNSRRNPT